MISNKDSSPSKIPSHDETFGRSTPKNTIKSNLKKKNLTRATTKMALASNEPSSFAATVESKGDITGNQSDGKALSITSSRYKSTGKFESTANRSMTDITSSHIRKAVREYERVTDFQKEQQEMRVKFREDEAQKVDIDAEREKDRKRKFFIKVHNQKLAHYYPYVINENGPRSSSMPP